MRKRRIIFVPQFPTKMRYQEWWYWKLPEEFEKAGYEVIILGNTNARDVYPNYGYKIGSSNFSPIKSSVAFELNQVQEYMDLKLKDDDILFLADVSFPGLFANALHHKPAPRMFAFCHATSLNTYDYFSKVRYSKFPVEAGQAMLFDKTFVASEYHYDKLAATEFWPIGNTRIVGLPLPPENVIKRIETEKKRFLISVSRPSLQKVDLDIEEKVAEQYDTTIYRGNFHAWITYCQALSESKVLLITSKEDTFGYQVVDAILNGCIPVVPDAFSYPELVPKEYRYNNITELIDILDLISAGILDVPELLCKTRINNFYDNIIQIMEGVRNYTI